MSNANNSSAFDGPAIRIKPAHNTEYVPNPIDALLNPAPIKFHSDTKPHFIKAKARMKTKCARLARRRNR